MSSILSWVSELVHSEVIIQSDGEPASEVVMRMVQSKSAMMKNPTCELVQQQTQRYSHQSNGGVERMVQTTSKQIKTHKIQIDKNSGTIITWLPRRAAWQHKRFRKRQESTNHSIQEDPTHARRCLDLT